MRCTKLGALILCVLLVAPSAWAAGTLTDAAGGLEFPIVGGSGVTTIASDTDLPATCTPGDLEANGLFLDTDDEIFYFCSATNTLTQFNPAEADTINSVFQRGGTITGAVSYATAFKLLDENNDGYAWWVDPTDGPQFVCVDNDVPNACASYTRTLAAGQTLIYKNSGGSNIFVLTESTGAITSTTIDARDNVVTSRFYWDLDLCGVSPTDGTTTGHIWNRDPLSTAPSLTADVDTNVGRCYATFADDDTTYGVQITRHLPDGFVAGTLGADIWWNTTGTGNARFQIQTKCYADDEADDAAFNTATVTTAAAGTSGRPNKQNVATIDTTGCVGGELIRIRFFRVRTEASDTLNAALNVEKVFFKGWDAQ